MPPLDRPAAGIILSEGPGEVRGVRLAQDRCIAFAAYRTGEIPLGTVCRGILRAHLPGIGAFIDIGAEAFLAAPGGTDLPLGARLLVQVARAASDDKPIGVTRSLTWTSPALTLTHHPGGEGAIAAARRLPETERTRLKAFLAECLSPERRAAGFSVTARPPALEYKHAALAAELSALLAEADAARATQGPPGPVSGPLRPLRRLLADLGGGGGPLLAPLALAPGLKSEDLTAELAPPGVDPFKALAIEAELAEVCAAEIPLPGGGRLTLEPTRALIAIDLDSGTDPRPAAVFVTEALGTVARLLRLRNLGGVVVIDPPRLTTAALARALADFKAALAEDPVPTDVLGVTRGGLIELTRPHHGPPLTQSLFGTEGQALAVLRALVYGPQQQGAIPVSAEVLAFLESARGRFAREQAVVRLGLVPKFRLKEA